MEPQTGHGGSGADLPYDGGKPNLGRSSHSRWTAHAGLRCLREDHLPLDEAGAERPPASPVAWPRRRFLASLLGNSSRALQFARVTRQL